VPDHSRRRRLFLALPAGAVLLCAGATGAAWYALRCDRAGYLNQAAQSWINPREEYLFACGQLWHSYDAGQTWRQISTFGLPILVRQGKIAIDRTAGRLYLAVVLASQASLRCPVCPLTRVQPVMYVSEDGGLRWKLAYQFPEGIAGLTRFRMISSDPDYTDAAWTVIVDGEQVAYYASNNGGQGWRLTCEERPGWFCDPPADFLEARHGRQTGGGTP
jgi:hypothetical protein